MISLSVLGVQFIPHPSNNEQGGKKSSEVVFLVLYWQDGLDGWEGVTGETHMIYGLNIPNKLHVQGMTNIHSKLSN